MSLLDILDLNVGEDLTGARCCFPGSDALFYPQPGGDVPAREAEARALCARCPVIDTCRAQGDRIETGRSTATVHGVRAGETAQQRLDRRQWERQWTCQTCGRPMRAAGTTKPGTITRQQRGLCASCYTRARRGRTA